MTKNTVSIALDRESLARFARLLGNHPSATGVHCGDDDGDVDGCPRNSRVGSPLRR